MRTWFKTLVTTALSLILGAGASGLLAAPISVAQEVSSQVGGWQVSPSPYSSVHIASSSFQDGSKNLVAPVGISDVDSNTAIKSLTAVKFTDTQLSDAVSNWGSTTCMDDLAIDDSTEGAPTNSVLSSPAPDLDEVRAPLAVWQSLTGLMFVVLITLIRPTRPTTIAN